MLPSQREVSLFIMLELRIIPSPRAVARLAFSPVASTVLIICAMTSDTFSFQLLRVKFSRVANIALHFTVLSGKRIFRILIMIKPQVVPR